MVDHERTVWDTQWSFWAQTQAQNSAKIGVISLAMAAWDAKMDVDVVEAHCYMRYAMNLMLAFEL